MIRNIEARIRKLEAKMGAPTPVCRSHLIGGNSEEECEAECQAMIADGKAAEDDMFIFLVPPTLATAMDIEK